MNTMRDIDLDGDGDFVFDALHADFASVTSRDLREQRLRNRLVSPRGSNPEDRSYGVGIERFLNDDDAPDLRRAIGDTVSAELAREDFMNAAPRVTVDGTDDGREITVHVAAEDVELSEVFI